MTETSSDNDMGPDTPASPARSTRRTRRLAIIGALALVLVAGAVLVGVKTTGARSGALVNKIVCSPRATSTNTVTLTWTDDADLSGGYFDILWKQSPFGGSGHIQVAGQEGYVEYSVTLTSTKTDTWSGQSLFYSPNAGPQNKTEAYGYADCR
ncbi:MAG: hypothetical protein NTZ03_09995 [Actinobacteria bacterium]|nr:hypothetical protein [Actinomycetota bacterium]